VHDWAAVVADPAFTPWRMAEPRRRVGMVPSPGVIGRSATTADAMAVNARVPRSDEDRLAALWEQPLDGSTVDDSIDDGIAALFSASDDPAPRAAPDHGTGGTHRSQARRPTGRGRGRRSRARRAGPQPARRSLAIGAALVVALLSAMIALSASTGSSDSADTASPAETDETTVLSPPARPTPVETEIRRAPATRLRAQRGRQHRGRTGARHERSRAGGPARAVPTREPHAVRSTRRRSEPAAAPQTALRRRIPPPTAPASSACDEFPPC